MMELIEELVEISNWCGWRSGGGWKRWRGFEMEGMIMVDVM